MNKINFFGKWQSKNINPWPFNILNLAVNNPFDNPLDKNPRKKKHTKNYQEDNVKSL